MKVQPLIFSFLILFSFTSFAQNKVIHGDTTFWFNYTQDLCKGLKLRNLEFSKESFLFRFRNQGQVVGIWEESGKIKGQVHNYIYHQKKRKKPYRDTLFYSHNLTDNQSDSIFNLVNDLNILTLKPEDEIEGWGSGYDGITYIIEFADPENYWYKTYWTPSSQDSIPEALILLEFIDGIEQILGLKEKYENFKTTLPYIGCYSKDGPSCFCYFPRSYHIGYHGSSKLPLGFEIGTYIDYLGKIRPQIGFSFTYQTGIQSSSYLSTTISKVNILSKSGEKLSDSFRYSFHKRELNFLDKSDTRFINHKFLYSININNNTSLNLGVDHFQGEKNETAGIIGFSLQEKKTEIFIFSQASLFNERIDYQFGLSRNLFKTIVLGLIYEKFLTYHDLNLILRIGF